MRKLAPYLIGLMLLLGLLAIPATVGAQPGREPRAVTISPGSGPAGTAFTISGSGYPAGPAVVVVRHSATNVDVGRREFDAPADGTFALTYDSTGDPAGDYRVSVLGGRGTQGVLLGEGTFSVTAPPGLPATGGGALAAPLGPARPLLAGLGLVLAMLASGLALRRHAG